mmetsp:Transcript_29186/g.94144  ORF Transcript_29186/g.94144 Transcript_29186/m.94144 type:complete len:258 (+) Transcript_29186:2-775(+)
MAETQVGEGHAGWKGDCGASGLLCYDHNDDASIVDAARNVFLGLLVAYAIGVVAARVAKSRKRMKLYWSAGLCFALCVVQSYFLYQAANTVAPSAFEDEVYRYDCHDSHKGGKVSKATTRPGSDLNPCFCQGDLGDGGVCVDALNRTVASKLSSKYQTYRRDCDAGRGSRCTRHEPCTPCELDRLLGFKGATYCGMCSVLNTGDCNFQPGVGPYCWKSPHSRRVEPCKRCCTESFPVFVNRSDANGHFHTVCEMPLP